MILYRIKRNRDNKFYLGKSKFTKYGTYFRKEQIMANLGWVLKQFPQEDIQLVYYNVARFDSIPLSKEASYEDMVAIMERDEKINKILDE